MKKSFASFIVLLYVNVEFVRSHRHAQDDSSCNKNPDRDSCFGAVDDITGNHCEWCVAGAIPSECMSQQQASLLPSGVFDCAAPGNVFEFGSTGTKYQLRIKENEKDVSDLCDSETKSISGYIDVKGSEYDKAGENKHLFFWMFEKRGTISSTTPVRLLSCVCMKRYRLC